MVVPLAPSVGNDVDLLLRYRAAGHAFVSLTIAGDDCGLAAAIHRMAQARRTILLRSTEFVLATSVAHIHQARAEGKLAVGLHLEGTECLERDIDAVDLMYALGIRQGILAFNQNNSAAGGCADLGNVGLSRLGRRYVERMREVGVLLDLSHTSQRSSFEAMDCAGAPVVFSHSNAHALHPHYRNVTDEQAKSCAATGGLIGISGSSAYVGQRAPLVDGVFQHIDHLVQLVGAEHVGIGIDFVADAGAISGILAERPDEWPTEGVADYGSLSYLRPEDMHLLIGLMQASGYVDRDIDAILGGNFLRVASAVWRHDAT